MSPIVQSGACALGKATIATDSLWSHATERKVELPQKLIEKMIRQIRASPVCAATADVLNRINNIAENVPLFSFGEILLPNYFPLASSFSIASTTSFSSGLTLGLNRATTLPSLDTRNFSKFQVMSPAVFWLAS